jgi:hypothetical protein
VGVAEGRLLTPSSTFRAGWSQVGFLPSARLTVRGVRQRVTDNLFLRLENRSSGTARKKFISCDILRIG